MEDIVCDPKKKEVRKTKKKCTDMKKYCRVILPPAWNAKEEANMQTSKEVWLDMT